MHIKETAKLLAYTFCTNVIVVLIKNTYIL